MIWRRPRRRLYIYLTPDARLGPTQTSTIQIALKVFTALLEYPPGHLSFESLFLVLGLSSTPTPPASLCQGCRPRVYQATSVAAAAGMTGVPLDAPVNATWPAVAALKEAIASPGSTFASARSTFASARST
jgi:hypothetical protein